MPIIRHKYTTIQAEANPQSKGKFEINSGITFKDVKKESAVAGDSQSFTISYEFTTRYNKNESKVHVAGEVLYVAQKDEAEDIVKTWEDKNTLPEKTVLEVGNYCLMKAQMQAISLANEVGLQSPVRLPKFEAKKEE